MSQGAEGAAFNSQAKDWRYSLRACIKWSWKCHTYSVAVTAQGDFEWSGTGQKRYLVVTKRDSASSARHKWEITTTRRHDYCEMISWWAATKGGSARANPGWQSFLTCSSTLGFFRGSTSNSSISLLFWWDSWGDLLKSGRLLGLSLIRRCARSLTAWNRPLGSWSENDRIRKTVIPQAHRSALIGLWRCGSLR